MALARLMWKARILGHIMGHKIDRRPRSTGDAWIRWWAHQDSNLEPDRYERSALTIEL